MKTRISLIILFFFAFSMCAYGEIAYGESGLISLGETTENMEKAGDGNMDSHILQVSPNPFNPTVTLKITKPLPDIKYKVQIFDVKGRMVKDLSSQMHNGHVTWNGTDTRNNPAVSGVYMVAVTAGNYAEHKTILLLK
jgi:flagellar hook assembly protein FlgD